MAVDAAVMPHLTANPPRPQSLLIIEPDQRQRAALEAAARAAGLHVQAVGSISEVECWPEGAIVLTDAAHCTPWWKQVGAVEVIALTRNDAERDAALRNGATHTVEVAATADCAVTPANTIVAIVRR